MTMAVRIGIDVGERSVGFSAVAYDELGMPVAILAAVSHIHDGGQDPDTGKSPKSRLATAGVARRTRRLVRNRRRRLRRLDDALREHGLPVPDREIPQTHDAWHARARLVEEVVADPVERAELVSLAARHIARHRGWRNPWWSYERLAEAPTPSDAFALTLAAAQERYPDTLAHVRTMGQMVSTLAARGIPIRPTKHARENPLGPLMAHQVQQEDSLAELAVILTTQGLPAPAVDALCRAAMSQFRPHIPRDRIGACALQPDQLRAPIASLEFQEFRVRQKAGDLRVRRGPDKRRLADAEYDAVVEFLLTWRDEVRPRWRDVAEHLGLGPRDLVDDSLDGSASTNAPMDRTSAKVEEKLKAKSVVGAWWLAADRDERSELIATITDLSGEDGDIVSESLAELLDDEEVLEHLDKLSSSLESGRAMYSQDTLATLNEVMRYRRCDLHTARKEAFGVDDTWQPPRPSFDDAIEHPTVARVNTVTRRFLMTAVAKWGMPEAIVVEHVRDAFAGPTALAEIRSEIRLNTHRREGIAKSLKEQGIPDVTRRDIKRNECVDRQNCVCLYCGRTITLLTCELDHILPRAGGGSSRRDNLVAVCGECNRAKGKLSFPAFVAKSHDPAITVEAAQARVRAWHKMGMSVKSFSRLKADVVRRLALTEDDDTDERSLESTAYAAREMRARIETFLDEQAVRLQVERGTVLVFSGAITSEARKAGGVDDRIRLRSFTRKSRFDRRHHAVDAAVLTTLDAGAARTLRERMMLQRDNRDTRKDPEWKEYRGATPGAQETYGRWAERIKALAVLLEGAISDDRIAVARPLRLVPRVGAVHKDTVEPLIRKSIGDAFSRAEVLRVTNRGLFTKLVALAAGGDLDADPTRSEVLRWDPARPVELFPSNAAYLPVRGGAVAIGDTIKWAQVFAWPSRSGFDYGMIRLYGGEFARIGFGGPGSDFLRTLPPAWSQAMRTANATLLSRILRGEARQIGWLARHDELSTDPVGLIAGADKVSEFLREVPERRWIVAGFFDPGRITISPAYLAAEGLDDEMSEAIKTVVGTSQGGVPLAVNRVLGVDGACVIRRTITGAPRWTGTGLPVSWNVREAAEKAFSQ